MQNSTTWVVVANGAQAKVYQQIKLFKIEEVASFEHPESRFHDQDLVSTKPGRSFQRGGVNRHSYQPESDPKHLEMEKFAKDLASYLSTAYQKGIYSRLYVLASPLFLGLLRQHLDAKTQKVIVAEIAKDMTEHSRADIEHQLAEL